jgi:hypothetical protein
VLAQVGRKLETLPADLAAAIDGGRVTAEIVRRFADMDSSPLLSWLLRFRGFRERLLADDLFLAKLAMECGVGVIAKVRPPVRHTDPSSVLSIFFLILSCFDLRKKKMESRFIFGEAGLSLLLCNAAHLTLYVLLCVLFCSDCGGASEERGQLCQRARHRHL